MYLKSPKAGQAHAFWKVQRQSSASLSLCFPGLCPSLWVDPVLKLASLLVASDWWEQHWLLTSSLPLKGRKLLLHSAIKLKFSTLFWWSHPRTNHNGKREGIRTILGYRQESIRPTYDARLQLYAGGGCDAGEAPSSMYPASALILLTPMT